MEMALNNLAVKVSQMRKVTMQKKMKQNLKVENKNKVTCKSVITGCETPNVVLITMYILWNVLWKLVIR